MLYTVMFDTSLAVSIKGRRLSDQNVLAIIHQVSSSINIRDCSRIVMLSASIGTSTSRDFLDVGILAVGDHRVCWAYNSSGVSFVDVGAVRVLGATTCIALFA